MIHVGDCLEVMAGMEPDSIDAIVTDPPYGLTFMGRDWDDLSRVPERGPGPRGRNPYGGWHGQDPAPGTVMQDWHHAWATAALRVAKPGAYLLAFGGTRTFHRLACAIEDAGWIIRDTLVWAYASGFPKSRANLKPAWEPILLARKPGPLRELAIDECRLPTTDGLSGGVVSSRADGWDRPWKADPDAVAAAHERSREQVAKAEVLGRWPANVILTDPIFDGGWEGVVGGGTVGPSFRPGDRAVYTDDNRHAYGSFPDREDGSSKTGLGYGDSGTYSRFFLIPKASRADREPLLPGQVEARTGHHTMTGQPIPGAPMATRENTHPTVKSTELMRHLVRLVTPQGGTVLDPFLGSGTTALAAEQEGFAWIGIERDESYVAIAEARLALVQRGLGLPA